MKCDGNWSKSRKLQVLGTFLVQLAILVDVNDGGGGSSWEIQSVYHFNKATVVERYLVHICKHHLYIFSS